MSVIVMPKIKTLLKELQAKFGKSQIMLGSQLKISKYKIPFGLKVLDDIIDGGIPSSRLVEIFGPEHGGKTTLGYRLLGHAQQYGTPMLIDQEKSWDEPWALKQGCDPDQVMVSKPLPAEAILEEVIRGVKMKLPLVLIDSVAALEPLKSHQSEMDQRFIGQIPLLLNMSIRKIFPINSPTIVVYLNQIREKVSIGRPMYGDLLITPGGRGIKSFAHLRMEVVRTGFRYKGTGKNRRRIGQDVAVRVVKSKMFIPWKTCSLFLRYGRGFREEE
jgi:recombination protein RecA